MFTLFFSIYFNLHKKKKFKIMNTNLYSLTLKPYRSLNKLGFFLIMFVLCVFSFITGIIFMKKGAWPVFGFFGLDVLLVYICFKINFRKGKEYEVIHLTKKELIIKKYGPKKLKKIYIFNPNWLNIKILNPNSHSSKIKIISKNKSITIGSFLKPEERIEIVELLKKTLLKHNFYYVK